MPPNNTGVRSSVKSERPRGGSSTATPGWAAFRDIAFRSPTFRSPMFRFLRRRPEEYRLSDRQPADASDRAVDSSVVLVRTNDRLHHFWRRTGRVGIKVHHRAANVAHRDGDGGGVVPLTE